MTIVDRLAWLLCDRTESKRHEEDDAPTLTNFEITYSWEEGTLQPVTLSPYTTSGSYLYYPETA